MEGFVPDLLVWGILGIFVVICLLWIFGSVSVVRKTSLTRNRKVIVALFLVPAPFVYFGVQSWHYNYELGQMREMERELVSKAIIQMKRLCQTEEKFQVFKPFALDGGLFLNRSWPAEEKLKLDFGSQMQSKVPVTDRQQVQEWKQRIREWRQQMQERRYGESFPPPSEHQYVNPVYWRRGMNEDSLTKAVGPNFFVEYDAYGLNEKDRYKGRAKYELTYRDISTIEDRSNWVARMRFQLIERTTSEVIAEYIGFAANINPAKRGESNWRFIEVCPKAREGHQPEGNGTWDVGGFFFSKLVKNSTRQ